MKNAYVSLVIFAQTDMTAIEIARLDRLLSTITRNHEIVVSGPAAVTIQICNDARSADEFVSTGPVVFVETQSRATEDQILLTGLARSVGDFIVEWRGSISDLDQTLLEELLNQTNYDFELVEVVERNKRKATNFAYWAVNLTRAEHSRVCRSIGRVYSRAALQIVLNTSPSRPIIDVVVAELSVSRIRLSTNFQYSRGTIKVRAQRIIGLFARGSRVGTTAPLIFAGLFAFFGVFAVFYSIIVLLFRGQTPEGWTTLMIVVGIGQASILAMLSFIWSRVNILAESFHTTFDKTSRVSVLGPQGDYSADT